MEFLLVLTKNNESCQSMENSLSQMELENW
jgi:hypothetical protein